MQIESNSVVTLHYTLKDNEGKTIDQSDDGSFLYLHGAMNIIPGLEKAMAGKAVGDRFEVTVEPAEAYGERNESGIQRIPAKHFKQAGQLQPGKVVVMQTQQGPRQLTIVKVGRFNIDVDTNHPMAGLSLTFDVEVSDVRDATDEEASHGHVHGKGGVEHE